MLLTAILLIRTEYITAKEVGTAAMSLIATFFGATFAFRLNQEKEAKAKAKEEIEAINNVLFLLIRFANAVAIYKMDYDALPTDAHRAFSLPAMMPPDYSNLKINYGSINFLIENNPQLLMDISIEEERFFQTIESIKRRNEFYVNKFQPLMEKMIKRDEKINPETAKIAMGELIYGTNMNAVQDAKMHIDETYKSLPILINHLHAAGKQAHSDGIFLKYLPDEKE